MTKLTFKYFVVFAMCGKPFHLVLQGGVSMLLFLLTLLFRNIVQCRNSGFIGLTLRKLQSNEAKKCFGADPTGQKENYMWKANENMVER